MTAEDSSRSSLGPAQCRPLSPSAERDLDRSGQTQHWPASSGQRRRAVTLRTVVCWGGEGLQIPEVTGRGGGA